MSPDTPFQKNVSASGEMIPTSYGSSLHPPKCVFCIMFCLFDLISPPRRVSIFLITVFLSKWVGVCLTMNRTQTSFEDLDHSRAHIQSRWRHGLPRAPGIPVATCWIYFKLEIKFYASSKALSTLVRICWNNDFRHKIIFFNDFHQFCIK